MQWKHGTTIKPKKTLIIYTGRSRIDMIRNYLALSFAIE